MEICSVNHMLHNWDGTCQIHLKRRCLLSPYTQKQLLSVVVCTVCAIVLVWQPQHLKAPGFINNNQGQSCHLSNTFLYAYTQNL